MPRSSLSTSKSGLTVNGDHRSQRKTKSKKSITTVTRKCNTELNTQSRLVGGADAENDKNDDASKETGNVPEEKKSLTLDGETQSKHKFRKDGLTSGPCCVCISQTPGSTGDKKVDEMIDYVHQNLQEAGKALATLGENFEHDSKLVFVDILGRIQQWSGIVQNKLETCKQDVEGLRKELVARVCEIAGKDREIADLKARLAECETREATYRSVQTASQPVAEAASPRPLEKSQEPVGPRANDSLDTRVDSFAEPLTQVGVTESTVEAKQKTESTVEAKQKTESTVEAKQKTESTVDAKEKTESTVDAKEKNESEVAARVDAGVQSSENGKEKLRREMELEAELSRLRRENERIIKERAEYENAIQRALLRGVSSLNVEALKVLRCPPTPCCNPCAPCSVSPTPAEEPYVPCETAKDETPRSCNTERRNGAGKSVCGPRKTSCSAGKHRRSTANSMVFLLHQSDTENFCFSKDATNSRRCAPPMMRRIEIPPCPRFIKQPSQCH